MLLPQQEEAGKMSNITSFGSVSLDPPPVLSPSSCRRYQDPCHDSARLHIEIFG
jgi:hypothetical protein